MPLGPLLLAALATSLWLGASDALQARLGRDPSVTRPPGRGGFLPRSPGVYMVEATLLTLLAALWFSSLGHGSWVLLFTLLGATIEWAAHSRPPARGLPDRRQALGMLAGMARLVVAGGMLRWIL